MSLSYTEENYLKAIYALSAQGKEEVSTNAIADKLHTKASSVTDMIKKLADKKLLLYEKYKGVTLTSSGKKIAINTIRKHRLWEVFLVKKLNFGWDEVHEIAEQLEHINSQKLVDRLDEFLEFPKYDPHGDPIPGKNGKIENRSEIIELSKCSKKQTVLISGVNDTSSEFLIYLNNLGLTIGSELKIAEIIDFDKSFIIVMGKKQINLSNIVTRNILVKIKK